jgi:hypothetical protein
MKIKKYILLLAGATLIAFSVHAFIVQNFKDWDTVVKSSKSILIVRCAKSPPRYAITNGVVYMNPERGLVGSDIELLEVLKGPQFPSNTLPHLRSTHWLLQGEIYLIFADDVDSARCKAFEDYRAVPLGHYFETSDLAGKKTLDEQIHTLLDYRLHQINWESKQMQEEKERLELYFKDK